MPEILPNWHPMFVHFTVGLLTTATLVYILAGFFKNKDSQTSARTAALWMLWAGAGFTILTVASGLYAFATVGHDDPSHLAMKDHRLWALITAGYFIALGVWSFLEVKKGKALPIFFAVIMIAGVVLLSITGLKGADLVYRYGLGVMALPQIEGEGHSHDEGESHDVAEDDQAAPPADLSNFDVTPAGTVNAFQAALKAGDGESALGFLDAGVLIYESGYVERSAEEYAGHHLPADMAFVGAMTIELISQTGTTSGDMATVISETRIFGTFNDKDYNLQGTGTMVLRRDGEGWKITHIHWSSHNIKE
ncbi:MAG: DUF2231 domain-containing protein [Sphingomonadales bacterium]